MTEQLWTGPADDPRRYRVPLVDGRPVPEPGGGGDGLVYRATDHEGNDVALKLLLHARAADLPDAAVRLERIAVLAEPHLMRPIEVFVGTALTNDPEPDIEEADVCWMAAEWVDGRRLEHVATDDDPEQNLRHVAQIARGVAALHRAGGIVHRDVKSGNVRVTPDGRAVLIDYGSPGRPSSDVPAGTPGWLSPEVAAGHAPGHAADVWGVGAIAHHLLVGSPPRLDGAACSRERLQFMGARTGLRDADELATHISRLLESEPGRRPDDLDRWADRLDAVLDGRGRSHRRRLVAATGVVAIGALALIAVVGGNDDPETPTAAASASASASRRVAPPTTTPPCRRELSGPASDVVTAAVAALDDDLCVSGAVESFVEADVVPLTDRDGKPQGVVIAGPGLPAVQLTTAEWASYREIAGRAQPDNSVTFGGYPTAVEHGDDPQCVTIELTTGGLIAGRRSDTQMFWIPQQARSLWESEGGLEGRLGFPTSNVFLSGEELRLEFEHGYLTARLDESNPGAVSWLPFDVASVGAQYVDDPGAELRPIGDLTGRVLRQAGGTTWFIDDDDIRHWIADGDTWNCLGAEQRKVGGDIAGYAVATLELGPPATCDLVR